MTVRAQGKLGISSTSTTAARMFEAVDAGLIEIAEHPDGKPYFERGPRYYRILVSSEDTKLLIKTGRELCAGPNATCKLCGKSVEPGSVQLNYQWSPLIHVKVAFCFRCTAETLLGAVERRFKPLADAQAAADYAEGRQHGFSQDEMRALALQGFGGLPLKPRKMSGEFISAAISLAGKLRRDWGSGVAGGLSHDTLKALEALLEAVGERIDGSRRVR